MPTTTQENTSSQLDTTPQQTTNDTQEQNSESHQITNETIVNLPPLEEQDPQIAPQPVTVDFENQRLTGFCCISISGTMLLICLVGFILQPVYGFLCILSILPAAIILFLIIRYKRSKASTELTFEMFWSGIISVIGVLLIELILTSAILVFAWAVRIITISMGKDGRIVIQPPLEDLNIIWKLLAAFLNAFLVAAAIEEIAKYLVTYRVRNRREFSNPEACVIYAIAGALGFATLENIGYVVIMSMSPDPSESQWVNGLIIASSRAVMAIPLHTITAGLIGVAFAEKIFLNNRKMNFFRIIAIPVLLHGVYDFLLLFTSLIKAWVWVAVTLNVILEIAAALYLFFRYRNMTQKWAGANVRMDSVVVEREPLVSGNPEQFQHDNEEEQHTDQEKPTQESQQHEEQPTIQEQSEIQKEKTG